MCKQVLNVGHCDYDHGAICRLIEDTFDARVTQAHGLEDTLAALRRATFHLVLINRKLLRDQSDGLEIIKRIKADAELAEVPVMLVTNYPQHQQLAVEAGAEHGFGKARLHDPDTRNRLDEFLRG